MNIANLLLSTTTPICRAGDYTFAGTFLMSACGRVLSTETLAIVAVLSLLLIDVRSPCASTAFFVIFFSAVFLSLYVINGTTITT